MGVIKNYTAPAKPNRYAADVAELVEAGEGSAYELVAATEKGGAGNSITTEHVKFQAAARDAGFTARVSERDNREDGTTRLVFVLTEKRERTIAEDGTEVEDDDAE